MGEDEPLPDSAVSVVAVFDEPDECVDPNELAACDVYDGPADDDVSVHDEPEPVWAAGNKERAMTKN